MGNTESSKNAFTVSSSTRGAHDVTIMRFAAKTATFTLKALDLRYWPKGDYEATSPEFHHPSGTRWRMQLSKNSGGSFFLAFILSSSEDGAPIRASIRTKILCRSSKISEVPSIESELFRVGEVTKKECLSGFSQPTEQQKEGLQVESEVIVVCSIVESAPGPQRSLKGDLAALFSTMEGADVMLAIGPDNVLLKAHSAVLRARSPFFAAMSRDAEGNGKSDYVLNLQEMEPQVVQEVLHYIYTDDTPSLSEMAEDLLVAADRYELAGLKRRCELELLARLTVENAARIAVLGVSYTCQTLLQAVVPFIQQRSVEVMGTLGWAEAVHTNPDAITTVSRLVAEAGNGELSFHL